LLKVENRQNERKQLTTQLFILNMTMCVRRKDQENEYTTFNNL